MATREKTLELRFYRWASLGLLSALVATAGAIYQQREKEIQAATAAVQEIPNLSYQLQVLNANFAKIEDIPLQVRENSIKIHAIEANDNRQDTRLSWLETKGSGVNNRLSIKAY